jgi:ABC-type polysaccharide/polyol phosphate export permease
LKIGPFLPIIANFLQALLGQQVPQHDVIVEVIFFILLLCGIYGVDKWRL